MNLYLDTNVLISFFARDDFSERAEAFLVSTRGPFVVSDLTAAEFSAVIARQVRIRERSRLEAAAIFGEFDTWCEDSAERVALIPEHFTLADQYLRRLSLPLSAPDAIHIAVAHRTGSSLVTFDRQMAVAARKLDLAVAKA